MVIYNNLSFPTLSTRPFFYANFVMTLDGKVAVKGNKTYEPIGSKNDFETFIDLRTYADALIHGKTTAKLHRTVETKMQPDFIENRKRRNKSPQLPYYIIANKPDLALIPALENNPGEKPFIVTNKNTTVSNQIKDLATILMFGEQQVELPQLATYLYKEGKRHVLVEGGPTLLYSFLKHNLLDEIFLTIAPKLFAGKNETLTLVEGPVFSPEVIKRVVLTSSQSVGDELFLRYTVTH